MKLLGLLFMCFFIQSASAESIRKDVGEYAGWPCSTPHKGSGTVVGLFSGFDENTMVSDDGYEPVDRFRCFKTNNECRGWLYTMQSLYSTPPPRLTRCVQY